MTWLRCLILTTVCNGSWWLEGNALRFAGWSAAKARNWRMTVYGWADRWNIRQGAKTGGPSRGKRQEPAP